MAISGNAWPQSARHFFNHKERKEHKEETMKDARAIVTSLYSFSLCSLRSWKISFIAFFGGHVFRENALSSCLAGFT
jgi:hypothetical protein